MRIGKRLVITIVGLNILGISILVGIILRLSYVQTSNFITNEITSIAQSGAKDITIWLEIYLDTSRTLAQIMGDYEQITVEERRSVFNIMLEAVCRDNPEMLAVWTIWEPNALDGLDEQFVNTAGTDASGRFIPYWSQTNGLLNLEPLVNYDTPGIGDYYLIPRRTGKETMLEPYYYTVNRKKILITSVAVPINDKYGRLVGVVGIDLDIAVIQEQVQKISPYENSVAAVFSNNGTVVGHFDPTRIGEAMVDTETDIAGPYLPYFILSVHDGEQYSFTNHVPVLNEEMSFISIPFTCGKSDNPWSLMIGIPSDTIIAPVIRILLLSIIIAVLMLFIMSVGAFFISRSISNPLKHMLLVLGEVGTGNLTKRLHFQSNDEIGDMTRSFNATLDKIRNLITVIKHKTVSLSGIGSELSANMTETAAAINEITSNIQSMKSQVINQSSGVVEAGTAMEKITDSINVLDKEIDLQAERVSQSSSSVEEMLANIQSVTQTLIKNTDNVQNLAEASKVGRIGLAEVAMDIQEIARESEGLLEINEVMENIASQTNLLSMNAAIEAAHAGEYGKGFAIVADEIRKLAESSGEQSQTVSDVLNKIKNSIDKITESTESVLKKFEAIDSEVKIVLEQEESIRNSMEEQGQGSKQILESIEQLNEITERVKESSDEMLFKSQEAIETSKHVEAITEEISHGMSEMAIGAEQINIAVHRVNDVSGTNKDDINELVSEVNKFQI
ncbi:MAG: methyl-accepting chemotaxis protein [Treponema sp.]|jgi:methyl-accepting chemotaxis protein|nr:methyl-accepting chemotaxis protein [Treponema sp.]